MGSAAGAAARQVAARAVAVAKGRPVASLATTSMAFRIASPSSSRLAQSGTDLLCAEDLLQGLRRTAPPPGPNATMLEPTWREFAKAHPNGRGNTDPLHTTSESPAQPTPDGDARPHRPVIDVDVATVSISKPISTKDPSHHTLLHPTPFILTSVHSPRPSACILPIPVYPARPFRPRFQDCHTLPDLFVIPVSQSTCNDPSICKLTQQESWPNRT